VRAVVHFGFVAQALSLYALFEIIMLKWQGSQLQPQQFNLNIPLIVTMNKPKC